MFSQAPGGAMGIILKILSIHEHLVNLFEFIVHSGALCRTKDPRALFWF